MVEFQFGETAAGLQALFSVLQVFVVSIVDLVVELEAFVGALHVGISNTHLCDDADRLTEATGFFCLDLSVVGFRAGDLLRKFEQVVGGADTDFHPAAVIEEAVGGVGEVEVHTDVREHHDDGLVKFENVDVTLHIDFIQFRTLEQSDLFHDLHFGQIEHRRHIDIEHGGIHNDVVAGSQTEESAEFCTAVFVAAGVVGQAFFHIHKTTGFVKGAERRDQAFLSHFFDQLITGLALVKQSVGNGDRTLGGSNLEVNADNVHLQVLGGTAGALGADQGTVIRLAGVECSQTEVHKTESKVNVQVVDVLVLRGGVTVGGTGGNKCFTAGSGRIVPVAEVVGNSEFRQHTECFGDLHFAGNFFFQFRHFDVEVELQSQIDTFFQFELMVRLELAPFCLFKILNSLFSTITFVAFLGFTACESCQTCKHHACHPSEFFHNALSPVLGLLLMYILCLFIAKSYQTQQAKKQKYPHTSYNIIGAISEKSIAFSGKMCIFLKKNVFGYSFSDFFVAFARKIRKHQQ